MPCRTSRIGSWPPSRIALWSGGLIVLLVAIAMGWLGMHEYEEAFKQERSREELLARVLEDHATRTVEATAIALAAVADLLAAQPHVDPRQTRSALNQSLAGLPFLRAISVLDSRGALLVSTTARDTGQVLDLGLLGPLPNAGGDRLGGFIAGRSLGDMAPARRSGPHPAGVGFIPMVHKARMRSGEELLLVAEINPDAFSNHQTLTLNDEASGALLTNYEGEVLATTPSIPTLAGSQLADHPVFRSYLPATEHASYLGAGARGEPQVVAFRVSRSRPLVVMVEHPQAAVRADWWQAVQAFAAVAGAALLFLAAMTATASRGLRSRESTRRLLDEAQAEVARRERELSVTITSVRQLIFRTDAEGAITFVNAHWTAVGGGSLRSAIGQKLHDLVLPEQRAKIRALFSAHAGAGVRTAHASAVGHDGVLRHFDMAVVPLQQEGGMVSFAGCATEVTERVIAEQKLQTQLAVSALMLEVSPLPLWMCDLSGNYVSVNQAWEEFSGCRRGEVIGQHSSRWLSREEAALHEAHDRALLAQGVGGRVRYEACVGHRDGSQRDAMLIKVVVAGDGGLPSGILSVLMDVSEFRAAERATREARDLAEEASRAKTEFVANMSHELRTPLQSIIGFAELGVARGREHARLAAMFGDIHAAGERMLALVNDLLDVSKIESAVGTFHLERIDLRTLVRSVARELEPLIASRQLRLETQLSDLPLTAKVDPTRFQQVVRNVLANAIKFSPPQGLVRIVGGVASGGDIQLTISDRGPGIPPAEIDRIFEPFVQSSRTKDGSGGTGLGLAICRKILEVHGGGIHAENLPEGGTAFHIELPARGATETAPLPL